MEPAHDGARGIEPSPTPAKSTGDPQDMERRLSNLSSSSFSSSTSSFNSLLDINEYENENEGDIIFNRADSQLTFRTPQASLVIKDQDDTPVSQLAQSPVSQMADKSFVGYDPSRIPSSVFARKATGQMEWSVASNESLFSIHMGNNSFSLGKSDELLFPYDNLRTGQPPIQPQLSPITSEGKEEVITKPPEIIVVNEETNYTNNRVGSLDNRLTDSTSTTHLSDDIGNTSNSFVFPVLTSDVSTTGVQPGLSKAAAKSEEAAAPPRNEEALWKEEEEVEKSKSGPQSPVAAPSDGNEEKTPEKKTWLSYFSCFSFCPTNLQCLGRANGKSNGNGNGNGNGIEPETKNSESKI